MTGRFAGPANGLGRLCLLQSSIVLWREGTDTQNADGFLNYPDDNDLSDSVGDESSDLNRTRRASTPVTY